jgi:adenylate cyclase
MSLGVKRALTCGLGAGALGALLSLSPSVLELEEAAGLSWLYAMRGAVDPPAQAAVVSISFDTAVALGESTEVDEWPRTLHAELIDRLRMRGAAVIVFDLSFDEARDPKDDDWQLARAMATAGSVVILERTESEIIGFDGTGGAVMETHVPPLESFKVAAIGSAPFTLPRVPIRVAQFWTFGRGAGGPPTLPVVALQAYLLPLYEDFAAAIAVVRPDVASRVPPSRETLLREYDVEVVAQLLRDLFQDDRDLAERVRGRLRAQRHSADELASLEALVDLYAGAESRYLHYYGPPRTIHTVPYHELLAAGETEHAELRGRVVFVGYSDRRQPEQLDEFYSVYTQRSGQALSGVEIGATAFANLLRGEAVRPLPIPAHLLTVFAWGLLLGVLFAVLPALGAVVAAAVLGAAYFTASVVTFQADGLWLPIVTPLLIQLPLALFVAVLWNYRQIRLQRERVQTALGYYVPSRVADRLAQESLAETKGELLYGTCLFTDAEEYTTVAESMSPKELGTFMNDYYQAMFRAVEAHGGQVADLAGDSMVAIWAAAQADTRCRIQACRAAIDVLAAVRAFNETRGRRGLPTRIGLDAGEVLLGNIGAERRFEYRAVGDIVSTASRIQGLNRLLGTQILVSDAALAQCDQYDAREIGTFLLRGKTTPVVVHELIDLAATRLTREVDAELRARFSAALESFRAGRWVEAERLFAEVLAGSADDGPSAYYLGLCSSYQCFPPADWRGVVGVAVK